jgi:hypothetical protein
LIGAVRRCCEGFPDPRRGDNGSYAMADFGLAAFSVFFAQSPSFLAHQRQLAAGHGRSNAHTLFGMSRIPGDSLNRAGFLGGILAWITRLGQVPPSERSSALRLRPGARCRWARAAGGG